MSAADPYRSTASTPTTEEARSMWLTCEIARERYAVPLEATSAVIRRAVLTPLIGGPPVLAGVIPLHGRMVAVVDPAIILGLEPAGTGGEVRLVIVDHEGEPVALLVNAVDNVVEVPVGQLLPPPNRAAAAGLLSHVFAVGDALTGALHVPALLSRCLASRPAPAS
jgi:purine-binding chemotaxis protein CheW